MSGKTGIETAVIVGNGPSVRHLPLQELRGKALIIGLNRAWQVVECDELVIADYNMLKPEEEPPTEAGTRTIPVWTLAERLFLSQWIDYRGFLLPLRQSVELWEDLGGSILTERPWPFTAHRQGLCDQVIGCRCSWHYALQVAHALGHDRILMLGFGLVVGQGLNKARPFSDLSREGQIVLASELAAYGIPVEVALYPESPLAEAGLGKQLGAWEEVLAWL